MPRKFYVMHRSRESGVDPEWLAWDYRDIGCSDYGYADYRGDSRKELAESMGIDVDSIPDRQGAYTELITV